MGLSIRLRYDLEIHIECKFSFIWSYAYLKSNVRLFIKIL